MLVNMSMYPVFRNICAVILGLAVGGAVNMALIKVSPHVIPPPAGVDVTSTKSLSASIHLFEPKHFVFPFLAHALGTLAGALLAFILAAGRRATWAFVIGVAFLAGGIAAACMIPAPPWFIILDLAAAYLPMAWIAIPARAAFHRRGRRCGGLKSGVLITRLTVVGGHFLRRHDARLRQGGIEKAHEETIGLSRLIGRVGAGTKGGAIGEQVQPRPLGGRWIDGERAVESARVAVAPAFGAE